MTATLSKRSQNKKNVLDRGHNKRKEHQTRSSSPSHPEASRSGIELSSHDAHGDADTSTSRSAAHD